MMDIIKSDRFKHQVITFAKHYKSDANEDIALRFIDAVEDAIAFIQDRPLACRVYFEANVHPQLKHHEFRTWTLKTFPHSIFFHIEHDNIYLDLIYAHRMSTTTRMKDDLLS